MISSCETDHSDPTDDGGFTLAMSDQRCASDLRAAYRMTRVIRLWAVDLVHRMAACCPSIVGRGLLTRGN